jgi:hypothetical protein
MRHWVLVAALAAAAHGQQQPEQPAQPEGEIKAPDLSLDLAKPRVTPFGEARSRWWTVGAGVAYDWGEATDLNLQGGYSYFLVKNVEFSAELNAWYFHQHGPDGIGINPAIVLRWHFFEEGPWTIYADAGIGLLFANEEVPTGGTRFDFTPRVGAGFTRLLDEETGLRMQAGLRWHHISNARLEGEGDNPARDGLMLYATLQFPF